MQKVVLIIFIWIIAIFTALNASATEKGSIPPEFIDEKIETDKATFACNLNNSVCHYTFSKALRFNAVINGQRHMLPANGSPIKLKNPVRTLTLQSRVLFGAKCLYFSAFTSHHDINWVLSVRNHERDVLTGIRGKSFVQKKMSIGVGTSKPYLILFYLYAFADVHAAKAHGDAIINKVVLKNGPCPHEISNLNCTFNHTFCEWTDHSKNHTWFSSLPFGLHSSIAHSLIWSIMASFSGHAYLWSPLVKPVNTKCFFLMYAKGDTSEAYFRVWLFYKIPGSKHVKKLIFEDISKFEVTKKEVLINLFIPYDFQIAFESRSKTIFHGAIVLETAVNSHPCEGTANYMNIFTELPEIPEGSNITKTTSGTTSTTPFGPI